VNKYRINSLIIALAATLLLPLNAVASEAMDKMRLADQLMAQGYTRKALDFYDLAIRANEHLWTAYLKRGDCLRKLGQHELARDDYKKVLQLDPGNPQAASRLHGHKRTSSKKKKH
jgi:Flp pilus assembly protein TadD